MKLTSPAFEHSQMIPPEFTCDGEGINPELHISDVPKEAKTLALICEDPDAPGGMFVHWLVWNIDPGTKKINQNSEPKGVLGMTDFGKIGYGGPCPPSETGTHRYFFKLFALDTEIDLPEKSSKRELDSAMSGHIIGQVELIGLYNKIE